MQAIVCKIVICIHRDLETRIFNKLPETKENIIECPHP